MLPTMTTPLARAVAAARTTVSLSSSRTFATSTRPLLAAARRPPASSSSSGDLHPLPNAAKQATPAQSAQPPIPPSGSGNSTAPEDHSSRPSGPGPSGPIVDPKVAAPETVSRGEEGVVNGNGNGNGDANWTTSFSGMSERPFDGKAAEVLGEGINEEDVEIKPDGLIYLPEIKYRRILTRAFGPGGWAMAPRGETNVGARIVSREWVLVCLGRFVSTARGEQEYFSPEGVATATEGSKSNALMRCCKDLGIASELWDPRFIRTFRAKHCVEVWVEDAKSGRKRKLWRRRDQPAFEYPLKETGVAGK